MRVFSGIAVKLAIVFLILGLIPMTTVAVLAYFLARDSMTETQVEYFVERVAIDTARNLDFIISSRAEETRVLAKGATLRDHVFELDVEQDDSVVYREALATIRGDLNKAGEILGQIDFLAVVGVSGEILVTSNQARGGARTGKFINAQPPELPPLWGDFDSNPEAGTSLAGRIWWPRARSGGLELIDFDREPLVQRLYGYPSFDDDQTDLPDHERQKNPESYSFGFTCGIPFPLGSGAGLEVEPGPHQAILVAFLNWSTVQDVLDRVNIEFGREHEQYKSGYTFLFAKDRDSIIAHRYRENYETKLVEDHGLADLREGMLASPDGVGHFYYRYKQDKVAGFALVKATQWQLGFGINEADFYGEVHRLRNLLLVVGLVVAGIIVILIAFSSRRITQPITNLIKQTNEIARGNLDARVEFQTKDEIGLLGDSFNKMAEDLKISNKKLIQAEKTAAWREMARQVAHEIKNPLTPIKLSAQLIERAHHDQHPDLDSLVEESVKNIVEQTESLRRIASDFSNFAAFPKTDRKPHSLLGIIKDCVKAYSNAESSGIEISLEAELGEEVVAEVDADEMKRVFYNLFNNAFEAMPDGGKIVVSAYLLETKDDGRIVEVRVKDRGRGISQEIAERLFEPYFTTRSSGTGLGLAICKKTIEGYGGEMAIHSEEGVGTTVILKLRVP